MTEQEIEELGDDWDFEASIKIIDEINAAVNGKSPDDCLAISQDMILIKLWDFQQDHGVEKTFQLARELLLRFATTIYYHPED